MTTETIDPIHGFEKAGLGKAPFRCVGVRENWHANGDGTSKPGGCCDYCSTGILYEFVIRSADDKVFVVGSDCVRKVGDKGLLKTVTAEEKKRRDAKTAARKVSDKARVEAAKARFPQVSGILAARPHPSIPGLTEADYVDWMFRNAGLSGQVKVARIVESA